MGGQGGFVIGSPGWFGLSFPVRSRQRAFRSSIEGEDAAKTRREQGKISASGPGVNFSWVQRQLPTADQTIIEHIEITPLEKPRSTLGFDVQSASPQGTVASSNDWTRQKKRGKAHLENNVVLTRGVTRHSSSELPSGKFGKPSAV